MSLAIAASLQANTVLAQEAEVTAIEKIQVTATRRTGSVQEIPINISALSSDVLQQQNIEELTDIARWVPGLTIQDQGNRSQSPIIVRGLNTNSSAPGSNAGTVATYYGEVPLQVDVRLSDIDRVEVLIGPQGTLYGAGSLGGAIRYIPKAPELDETTFKIYGDVFDLAQSDSLGGEAGFVFNTPILQDKLALRFSFNHYDDPGFIDYNFVVREGGVSLPDPDFTDPQAVAENLQQIEDANGEQTTTARLALRWTPTEWLDSTLSYFVQNRDIEGRSISHFGALSENNPLSELIGPYDSAYRYEEPRDIEDSLLSLEIKADLGFAEFVSATGLADSEAVGQRDQTDLLIRLDYGYEEFPAFSSFTREDDDVESFAQEFRLVSTTDSRLSWIVGYFANIIRNDGASREFTPGFDQFAVDNFGGVQTRPDSLEFLSVGLTRTAERAFFGELSYDVTDKLNLTLGTRFFDFDVFSRSAIDLPLFRTVFNGEGQDSISLDFEELFAKDDGELFKFNASYQFTPDLLGYFTVSEGVRIGGSNGVGACPDNIDEIENQIVCALPNEEIFASDTTTNYEVGFKSTWLKNRLHFNASLFYIEWDDAQINGATVNGQQPITANAEGAESRGIELSTRAILNDNLAAYATYSYAKAELTADAPFLFGVFGEQGSDIQEFNDGQDGDRLPGSPENQFSVGLNYQTEVFEDKLLDINYGLTYQSDILTTVGARADGETISGYALSNIAATLSDEAWSVTFYVDNLFDKFAFTNARRDRGDIGLSQFASLNSNGADIQRNYGHFLLTPRQVGLRFEYRFSL